MTTYDYDLFVIGAGSGGVRAARVASSHGARVGIAEEYRVGGTCVIRGCVPKKLLVYGAHFAEDLEDAGRFGWSMSEKRFDWSVLRDNVLAEVERLNGLYARNLEAAGVRIFQSRAVLVDAHTLDVGGERITADRILIAVGARPQLPHVAGAELGITSDDVFHLDRLPRRIVITGGGYIANEFAGIFNQLGVETTLLVRGDVLLRGYDRSLCDRLHEISAEKGIRFRFNTALDCVERLPDGCLRVSIVDGDPIETDTLLYAIGRIPHTRALGLDRVGVACDPLGAIVVDDKAATSVENIYAIGDVTNRIQLTPVAIREGQAFADTFYGGRATTVDYQNIPSAVFSHPPLASVGLTEDQARDRFGSIRVYASDFRPMKNVLADRRERSLYKLVVDVATDRILGAHIIGPEAAEIMQLMAVIVKAGLTKAQLDDTVALHPTMAEELVLLR